MICEDIKKNVYVPSNTEIDSRDVSKLYILVSEICFFILSL